MHSLSPISSGSIMSTRHESSLAWTIEQGAPMIKGIKFASIPVRDQDKALEFYTKKLGFKIITDSPFDGTQRWIELGLQRSETKLVLFTGEGQEQMIGGF